MKYEYGDTVVIKLDAPHCYFPGEKGALCGVRRIETKEQATAANVSVGTVLWQVEFCDGSFCEIPEIYLKASALDDAEPNP